MNRLIALLLGAVIVWVIGVLAMSADNPSLVAPFPVVSYILVGYTDSILKATLYGPVLFLLWCWQLASERRDIPKRSVWLFGILALLSAAVYWGSWDDGLEWSGSTFMWSVTGINALIIGVLFSLILLSRRSPRYWISYIFHLLLFSWLVSYWFPWVGETP